MPRNAPKSSGKPAYSATEIIERAVKAVGTIAELAKRLDVKRGPIEHILRTESKGRPAKIPGEWVRPLEQITGVPRWMIAPAIFDPPAALSSSAPASEMIRTRRLELAAADYRTYLDRDGKDPDQIARFKRAIEGAALEWLHENCRAVDSHKAPTNPTQPTNQGINQ